MCSKQIFQISQKLNSPYGTNNKKRGEKKRFFFFHFPLRIIYITVQIHKKKKNFFSLFFLMKPLKNLLLVTRYFHVILYLFLFNTFFSISFFLYQLNSKFHFLFNLKLSPLKLKVGNRVQSGKNEYIVIMLYIGHMQTIFNPNNIFRKSNLKKICMKNLQLCKKKKEKKETGKIWIFFFKAFLLLLFFFHSLYYK